ncbi:hypothetical protein H7B90_00665 [Cohnella xylanilytica]|uniref:Uncharacterized protein n=1 Tax=Cohnella xylanilytica TaxID=557555 RepID=A0A841TUR7_9BACL|nr:hypothetical protein [Cohnella xylanilytica]MBB6689903.1 hypothetical protein [Cohnella xylanilytica]
MANGRFETIPLTLEVDDAEKHNRNWKRADSDLASLQAQLTAEQQARIAADAAHATAPVAHTADQIQYVPGQSVKQKTDMLQAQVNNIVGQSGSGNTAIDDMRLGADGVSRQTPGVLIREIHRQQIDEAGQAKAIGRGPNLITTDRASGADVVIPGRTLVNWFGKDGGFGVDINGDGLADGWFYNYAGTVGVSLNNDVKEGVKSQKLSATLYSSIYKIISYRPSDYFLVLVWAKVESGGSAQIIVYDDTVGKAQSQELRTTGDWKLLYVKFTGAVFSGSAGISLHQHNPTPVYFSGARLFKVDATTYAKIDVDPEYTGAKLAEKYPYVEGVKHLEGVGLSLVGINQIPPVTDSAWTLHPHAKVLEPYELQLAATGNAEHSTCTLPALPNTTYSFGWDGNGNLMYVEELDSNGGFLRSAPLPTFTTLAATRSIRVFASNHQQGAGTFVFKDPMLVLGNVIPESLVPRNDDYLYLPTTLAEGDTFDSRLGTVTRGAKTGVILDGSLGWFGGVVDQHPDLYKVVYCPVIGKPDTAIVEKYTGQVLEAVYAGVPGSKADQAALAPDGNLYVNVSLSESGWVASINPSANAVKALFNGWRATANDGGNYTSWVSVLDGSTPVTNTLSWVSANKAPGWSGWGTLSYKLAKAEAQVVVPEGAIGLHTGGNMVELIEGIVVREKANPQLDTGNYWINHSSINGGAGNLKDRTNKIINVFKNGVNDTKKWIIRSDYANSESANGGATAYCPKAEYDREAEYTVIYISLDKYKRTVNAIAATINYNTNAKTVTDGLVRDMADAETQISIHDRILAEHTARLLALEV